MLSGELATRFRRYIEISIAAFLRGFLSLGGDKAALSSNTA